MTFTFPLKLKLALLAVLTTCLVATAPAGAIVAPVQCGKITVKGKQWRITADQIRCSTAKKWSATYIRSFKAPRYYKCKKGTSIWRVCVATRYNPDRTFFIRKA
jgi:hypothetical protein